MLAIGPIAILALLIVIAIVVAVMNATLKSSGDGKPRGFPWILMLFGIVVIGGIATLIIQRARPVEFVLEVRVPTGKGFVGEVVIDGRRISIDDASGPQFTFTGKQLSWTILIDDDSGTESIEVELLRGSGGGGSSTGAWGSRGFAEKQFLGGAMVFTNVDESEWRSLMQQWGDTEEEASILLGPSAPSNPVTVPEGDEESPMLDESLPADPMSETRLQVVETAFT